MRRFADSEGREWEVVVGRESWGRLVAIVVPVDGATEIRQTGLLAGSYDAAAHELDAMSEDELRELLDRSEPKTLD